MLCTRENAALLYVEIWPRITAPAEIIRAALAISRKYDWNLGIVDVIAAFLQTPFAELAGAPLVYGVPPKILVRAGLCQSGEIWKLTHAVYGLQESPRLWGQYRDIQLARIQIIYEGKRVAEWNLHGGRCCKRALC